MGALKNKLKISILTAALAASFFTGSPASAEEAQGTDGTEMHVMEPEMLEIRLGKEWAGKKFRLKTDTYMYPGTITVGEDGMLRTELGGSRSYTLMAVDTGTGEEMPAATENPEEAGTPDGKEDGGIPDGKEVQGEDTGKKDQGKKENLDVIPKKHIILFAAGMTVSVIGLAAIHISQKRRDMEYGEEDYDEEDYDEDGE